MIIGAMISAENGYANAAKTAVAIGADTFQTFSRSPQGWMKTELDMEDLREAQAIMESNSIGPVLIHAPFTLNMASARSESFEFSKICFDEDLQNMKLLPSNMYVIHPGSKRNLPYAKAIEQITSTLCNGMKKYDETFVLLETMSGKGSEIGSRFEELKDIIDGINDNSVAERIGICLDFCHMFCAGYDIENDFDSVMRDFDKIIGINKIKAVHLNDTANPFASRRDKHARIGEGFLGIDVLRRIMRHKTLKNVPFYLETPHKEVAEFADEIRLMR